MNWIDCDINLSDNIIQTRGSSMSIEVGLFNILIFIFCTTINRVFSSFASQMAALSFAFHFLTYFSHFLEKKTKVEIFMTISQPGRSGHCRNFRRGRGVRVCENFATDFYGSLS